MRDDHTDYIALLLLQILILLHTILFFLKNNKKNGQTITIIRQEYRGYKDERVGAQGMAVCHPNYHENPKFLCLETGNHMHGMRTIPSKLPLFTTYRLLRKLSSWHLQLVHAVIKQTGTQGFADHIHCFH